MQSLLGRLRTPLQQESGGLDLPALCALAATLAEWGQLDGECFASLMEVGASIAAGRHRVSVQPLALHLPLVDSVLYMSGPTVNPL